MITGTTPEGFRYKIKDSVARDYRLLRLASKANNLSDEQALTFAADFPELVLGSEGLDQLINFLTKKDGYPDSEKVFKITTWIFNNASKKSDELKKLLTLSNMIACDEHALICDLAETYHIYDYESLPLQTVAILSIGLRDESRIKMKMNKVHYTFDMWTRAAILDDLNWLVWTKTKDGQHNRNRPKKILDELLGKTKKKSKLDTGVFSSIESYEKFIRNKKEALNG